MHRNGTGVLNDFDLARLTTPGNVYSRGFDRTGTTPFLALDLLAEDAQAGKVERRYRHELGIFFLGLDVDNRLLRRWGGIDSR